MKSAVKNAIIFVILFLSFTILFSINWIYANFGNISLEEVMFQIRVPMTNANTDYYYSYIKNALIYIVLSTIVSFVVLMLVFRRKKKSKERVGKHAKETVELTIYKRKFDKRYVCKLLISILILTLSLSYTTKKTELLTYIQNQSTNSNLIEIEYVDTNNVDIQFPEEKRNLIYIFLESMEATLYTPENGGAFNVGLIDDLEELALENVVFSNADNLKGLYSLPGSTWTTGAMTAQTMGLPLKIPIDGNSYGEYMDFLPGAKGIGDILKDEGYNQMLMIGSNASFGGRDHLFKQHGNYEIFDFSSAVEEGKKQKDDFIWWGFPDGDLFEYAKEKLIGLAEQDKPFNFTMLTVDTHAPDGYLCEECEEISEVEQYFNVMHCSSKKVVKFVQWIQEQDFYGNTTIVICGDHPSMKTTTYDDIVNNGYERTVVDIIINPVEIPENTQYKYASTMDMFPTTLASIGVKIEGNKLGLGTNLFSNEETLVKKYGLENVKNELIKNSRFYNNKFIYNDK